MNINQPAVPAGRPNLRSWQLEVVDSFDAPPNMRRVVFTAPDIADFDYKPGQAIVFMMPLPNGETGRRHYTIRSADRGRGTFSVDFLLHGDAPSPSWARSARPGDRIEAKGPRGGAWLRADSDWHLLSGDETGIPAIAHMLESAPAGGRIFAFIEVDDANGEIAIETRADADIRWLHRNGVPHGLNDLALSAVESFALPAGRGHAVIIGETSNVRRQRHALIAKGLSRDQISSEGYWRPDRVGGHDHVDD
jgi:NADPH-dependent ferric siderophore reductase